MQLPDGGFTQARSDETAKRRRGMMATVLTSAGGLGTPNTTASSTLGG